MKRRLDSCNRYHDFTRFWRDGHPSAKYRLVADENRGSVHPLRTALAAQGVHLSALFFAVFEKTRLPGNPRRRPRLNAPPGPSTGGGKLARQSLTLVPEDDREGPSVVFGWVDSSLGCAELRSWPVVADSYQRRCGQSLDIPVGAYNRFLGKVASFLREQDVQIERIESPHSPPVKDEAPVKGHWFLWLLLLLATLSLGIGIGVLFMLYAQRSALPM